MFNFSQEATKYMLKIYNENDLSKFMFYYNGLTVRINVNANMNRYVPLKSITIIGCNIEIDYCDIPEKTLKYIDEFFKNKWNIYIKNYNSQRTEILKKLGE